MLPTRKSAIFATSDTGIPSKSPRNSSVPEKIPLFKFPSPYQSSHKLTLPRLYPRIESSIFSLSKNSFDFESSQTFRSLSPVLPKSDHYQLSPTSLISNTPHSIIKACCGYSHKGLVRGVNEDRFVIVPKIHKPDFCKKSNWPECAYFAIYDGHGGKECCDYLKQHLYNHVIQNKNFIESPVQAILKGFEKCENDFIQYAIVNKKKSGSCALVMVIIESKIYIANLGDSRAILSKNKGEKITQLSVDHRPDEFQESLRIRNAGGEIYYQNNQGSKGIGRIIPGKLSVTRAFGDIDAKIQHYGGNSEVIIAVPEITEVKISKNTDFVVIATDGVFDKLNNKDVVKILFNEASEIGRITENSLSRGVQAIICEAILRNTTDNATVVAVAFENFGKK